MANALLDALGDVGYALDTPGAYLRGALGGKVGSRMSGQDLLSGYGLSSQDDPWGGAKGFAAEALLDPLALAGPVAGAFKGVGKLTKGARALAGLGDANPLARRLAELGAGVEDPLDAARLAYRQGETSNPLLHGAAEFAAGEEGAIRPFQEVGRRTDPDYVNSLPWWHGSATPGLTPDSLDAMKTDPGGLFGRGIYTTADPMIAGGSGGYSEARMSGAMSGWGRDFADAVMPHVSGSPEMAGALDDEVRALLQNPDFRPPTADYLRQQVASAPAARPGRAARYAISEGARDPQSAGMLAEAFGRHGIQVPAVPRPTLYEAGTDFGRIADLDAPPTQDLYELLQSITRGEGRYRAAGLEELRAQGKPAGDMVQLLAQASAPELSAELGDFLTHGLRHGGYDALSHTGGLRAGGGRNLHQVVIGLDPGDRISKVGRPGGITRFDPVDLEAVMRRFGGGQ